MHTACSLLSSERAISMKNSPQKPKSLPFRVLPFAFHHITTILMAGKFCLGCCFRSKKGTEFKIGPQYAVQKPRTKWNLFYFQPQYNHSNVKQTTFRVLLRVHKKRYKICQLGTVTHFKNQEQNSKVAPA